MRKYILGSWLLVWGMLSNAQPMLDQNKLHQYLQLQQQRLGFNGVVMIAKDGKTIFRDSIGESSIELGVPISAKSIFPVASITKCFTATLTLLAINEGKLSLSDSLAKFFPTLSDGQWRKITVDQLLSHRSGIPHNEGIDKYWSEKSLQQFSRVAAIKEILSLKLESVPGTATKYSSPGYFLLATIVENSYQKSFGALVKEKIGTALQLQSTGQLDNQTIVPGLVSGYVQNDDQVYKAPYRSFSLMKGSGDLYSDGPDLLAFLNSFGTGHWPADLEHAMFTAHAQEPVARGDLYGYGWFTRKATDELPEAFYHGGGSYGVSALMARYPTSGLALVILSNKSVLPVNEIWQDIEKIIFGRPFVLPIIRKSLSIDEKTGVGLVGSYQEANGTLLQIAFQNEKLYAKLGNNPFFELYQEAPFKFYGKKVSIDFIFEQNSEGKTVGIKASGMGKEFRFTKR